MFILSRVRRFSLLAYFTLAYAFSGFALAVLGLPHLSGTGPRNLASLALFPVMVVGVGIAGIALTAVTSGRAGLADLRRRLTRWRLGWYAVILLLPPFGIVLVLTVFRAVVSPRFTPQFLIWGLGIGLVAGGCEELGWTGFAYPRFRNQFGALGGALLLGVLWGLWHFPVVDSLGAASPHRHAFPAFLAAFVALMTALRVLIAWLVQQTESLLGAQLLHASSTGFLVVLSPLHVTAGQEALWYGGYAVLLWFVVAGVVLVYGTDLRHSRLSAGRTASTGAEVFRL